MNRRKSRTMRHVALAAGAAAAVLLGVELVVFGQSPGRGTISGRITADQGQVRAFRVAAHNLDRRVWYTVFTDKAQYTVPQALSGRYELTVIEPDYESPRLSVKLGAGETQKGDLAVKKRTVQPERLLARGDEGPQTRPG